MIKAEIGVSYSKKELKHDIRKKCLKVIDMKTSLAYFTHYLSSSSKFSFIQGIVLAKQLP